MAWIRRIFLAFLRASARCSSDRYLKETKPFISVTANGRATCRRRLLPVVVSNSCAPSSRKATTISLSMGRQIQAAMVIPRRAKATMTQNGVCPLAKFRVPSTGSTIQTGASPSMARRTAGLAETDSSPTTQEPGKIFVSASVSSASASRSAMVTKSLGLVLLLISPSARF